MTADGLLGFWDGGSLTEEDLNSRMPRTCEKFGAAHHIHKVVGSGGDYCELHLSGSEGNHVVSFECGFEDLRVHLPIGFWIPARIGCQHYNLLSGYDSHSHCGSLGEQD